MVDITLLSIHLHLYAFTPAPKVTEHLLSQMPRYISLKEAQSCLRELVRTNPKEGAKCCERKNPGAHTTIINPEGLSPFHGVNAWNLVCLE